MSILPVQLTIVCTDEMKEVVSAELDNLGFDGIWEEGDRLHAFISTENFNEKAVYDMLSRYGMENSYHLETVEDRNWNEEWESSFNPIYIDDRLVIRASFHEKVKPAKQEIIIDPRMSFGTGHHETTELMLRMMLDMPFKDKRVLDMGCGTGILSILAHKLGAKNILAVDIDQNSVDNARDNLKYNQVANVECKVGGAEVVTGEYDVILSNITRNINLSLLPILAGHLVSGGSLIISGFLDFDRDDMLENAIKVGFDEDASMNKNKWQCLKLRKR